MFKTYRHDSLSRGENIYFWLPSILTGTSLFLCNGIYHFCFSCNNNVKFNRQICLTLYVTYNSVYSIYCFLPQSILQCSFLFRNRLHNITITSPLLILCCYTHSVKEVLPNCPHPFCL